MNYCFYTQWELLQISGSDSASFLNRLLTIRVSDISQQCGAFCFLLNARGQVREAFWLLRKSECEFLALTQTGAQSLQDALDQFIFAEKMELQLKNDLRAFYFSFENQMSQSVVLR